MTKKTPKKQTARIKTSQETRSALRAFVLAHTERWDDGSLKDLKIYLQAYHDFKGSTKTIEVLLVEEMKSIGIEMKAKHMQQDLFSTNKNGDGIMLGSCFCPKCNGFKNFRKECPHCGFHEMTV